MSMDFGSALNALKMGYRVARQGWDDKGKFLFLVPASTVIAKEPPLVGMYREGTEVHFPARINLQVSEGWYGSWVSSPSAQEDILADDWEILA